MHQLPPSDLQACLKFRVKTRNGINRLARAAFRYLFTKARLISVQEIGKVADGATESSASVILYQGKESWVSSEELVLIKNGGKKPYGEVLGVLRKGLGRNDFLNTQYYKPELAYVKHGGEPSGAREVFSFTVMVVGEVSEGKPLAINRKIIAPGSSVSVFEDENPLEIYLKPSARVPAYLCAHLDRHPSWRIPADASYIPYHVGVYGTTGSGKSWLAKNVLMPFYLENGYDVLVLDWSGMDYAPDLPDNSIPLSKVFLGPDAILSYLSDISQNFFDNRSLQGVMEEICDDWDELAKEGPNGLLKEITKRLDQAGSTVNQNYKSAYLSAVKRFLRRLTPDVLYSLTGTLKVEDVLTELAKRHLVVIDMAGFRSELKLSFFLALANAIYSKMIAGEDMSISLVIDEAPQYSPFKPEGLQVQATDAIRDLAALGRKHKLNLTLLSQGVAGDIGVNAAIRRNLNTNFYGRLHPLDVVGQGGAKEWLEPYGITPEYMLTLQSGQFYFSGLMNPSPMPLLLFFEPNQRLLRLASERMASTDV